MGFDRAAVTAAGIVLWAFVLPVPAMHLNLVPSMPLLHVLGALAPIAVLGFGVQWQNAVAVVVAFPVSLLPLLMLYPELTGPRVYGPGAFVATAVATIAYLRVVWAPPRDARRDASAHGEGAASEVDRRARLLTVHTIAIGVLGGAIACAVHFYRPVREAIASGYPGYEQRATTFVGLLMFAVWLLGIVRPVVTRLGGVLIEPSKLTLSWYRYEATATDVFRNRTALAQAVVIGAIATMMLIAVLSLGGGR